MLVWQTLLSFFMVIVVILIIANASNTTASLNTLNAQPVLKVIQVRGDASTDTEILPNLKFYEAN